MLPDPTSTIFFIFVAANARPLGARPPPQLDAYLRALLASPSLALSPLVCTFLDALDARSFRAQLLPRLAQMEAEQRGAGSLATIPTQEEAPNGW